MKHQKAIKGIFGFASILAALVGYGLVGLVSRFITPWVSGRAVS